MAGRRRDRRRRSSARRSSADKATARPKRAAHASEDGIRTLHPMERGVAEDRVELAVERQLPRRLRLRVEPAPPGRRDLLGAAVDGRPRCIPTTRDARSARHRRSPGRESARRRAARAARPRASPDRRRTARFGRSGPDSRSARRRRSRTDSTLSTMISRVSMADYKPQQLDMKWQQHWTSSRAFEVEARSRRVRSSIAWRCSPIRRATRTSATCATTSSATSWRARSGCAATTCCIRSAGTPSGCRRRTPRSRPARIPRSRRSTTSRT